MSTHNRRSSIRNKRAVIRTGKKPPKKRKSPFARVLIPIIIIAVVAAAAVIITKSSGEGSLFGNEAYVASENTTVKLYKYDYLSKVSDIYVDEPGAGKEMIAVEDTLTRGTKVSLKNKTLLIGSDGKVSQEEDPGAQEYYLIEYNGDEYYIPSKNLVKKYEDIVLETTKYVRTSVTVYEDTETPKIASFIKKGEKLEVTGYSGLNEDGTVEMYQVKGLGGDGNTAEGYVFAKYLVDTQKEADAVYNENDTYDIHKDRTFSYELYGGSAANLDYYPYERTVFEDNPIEEEAMSMYLTVEALETLDDYIDLALKSGVDTMIVDVKDGYVAVKLDTTEELCDMAYSMATFTKEQYKACIDKIKDAGFYVVGRIVVFNDTQFGSDHPETSIISEYLDSYWPSAFSRDAWYYNVCMAIECVESFGFNEIQFDYVRFPETSFKMSTEEGCDFKNVYNEEKAEAIQNFLYYACDMIHRTGAYLSVDVFGECVDEYVTAYGQYWPSISNIVDVISGMPYTDHFGTSVDTWSDPYSTVHNWALKAASRQSEIPTPAIVRTWVTCYDTPNWAPTVDYDAEKLEEEVQALFDGGLTGGFMTWNGKANFDKYTEVAACWGYAYEGSSRDSSAKGAAASEENSETSDAEN